MTQLFFRRSKVLLHCAHRRWFIYPLAQPCSRMSKALRLSTSPLDHIVDQHRFNPTAPPQAFPALVTPRQLFLFNVSALEAWTCPTSSTCCWSLLEIGVANYAASRQITICQGNTAQIKPWHRSNGNTETRSAKEVDNPNKKMGKQTNLFFVLSLWGRLL